MRVNEGCGASNPSFSVTISGGKPYYYRVSRLFLCLTTWVTFQGSLIFKGFEDFHIEDKTSFLTIRSVLNLKTTLLYPNVLPENNEGIELIPQILTNNSRDFLNTAEWLIEMGYKEINFNLGCPSKDVVSRGKGSGFLEFPEKLDSADITVHPRLGKDYYRVMWL